MKFKLIDKFKPSGDQPEAISKLVSGIKKGNRYQTLLGVTGSGKTYTMASVIEKLQRPALVIAHNKTLAAQLASEFRELFPDNAVEYFVSYYDYYQPEAYLPNSDTYIEKEATINNEIDRLRHAATQSILSRRDTIIVASVSAIYSLGSPKEYESSLMHLGLGDKITREQILRKLVELQYERTNSDLKRGSFRARGGTIEILPVSQESQIYKVTLVNEVIKSIEVLHNVTRKIVSSDEKEVWVFPAKHYVVNPVAQVKALTAIEKEMEQRVEFFKKNDKLLEADRIERRTKYDLEMIREIGFCNGIENYSRQFDGRKHGEPPFTLLDYFPKDYLLFLDESHVSVPQIGGMYAGDKSRKEMLVEHGFRLPSAIDNRPLKFNEFEERVNQAIFTSATPADFERQHSSQIVEQVIRPTGLVDPQVEIRQTTGQIDDVLTEIKHQNSNNERTLVTTLTKKMAEDLT